MAKGVLSGTDIRFSFRIGNVHINKKIRKVCIKYCINFDIEVTKLYSVKILLTNNIIFLKK